MTKRPLDRQLWKINVEYEEIVSINTIFRIYKIITVLTIDSSRNLIVGLIWIIKRKGKRILNRQNVLSVGTKSFKQKVFTVNHFKIFKIFQNI